MVATTSKKVRFANNNQVKNLSSSSITVSSEQSNFPFENCQDDLRFRVWKPAGNFTIDSSNKKIYINDGSDKTITLTEANYTYSTLASHIQTQLNASSSNWTVSYSTSTNKFTIENTSSVTLRETETTDAAWDTLGYTDGTDHAGTSFEADEARNHTSEYVIWDLGAAKDVDFFACIGPSATNFDISSSMTATLKGNNINSFSSPAVSVTLSRSENGIFYFEDDVDMGYRYWKFEFEDKQNTVGPEGFNIAHFYLGDYNTLTNTNIARGFTKALVDQSTRQTSESGAKFHRVKSKYWKYSGLNIVNLKQSERLELETFFQTSGITEPWYLALDPTTALTDSVDELTKFVLFDKEPQMTHTFSNYFNVSFSVSEVI